MQVSPLAVHIYMWININTGFAHYVSLFFFVFDPVMSNSWKGYCIELLVSIQHDVFVLSLCINDDGLDIR